MKHSNMPIYLLILSMLCLCALPVVGLGEESTPSPLSNCAILHEPEFGGVYITATIDEFNALGYNYGDSVDIQFSNGYTLKDQPYYNGYYTHNGVSLLGADPG